eukprot:gnl/MRDRNA2_/MRDRNA2_14645_c0_seq1.p1 gnl/MRDRNA2_/MRDRNA2_14645_c0~~gnl/MRDRNA2_/MRDRNA2_14645_c0_seq1.p1  ORF type:complete len:389 (-),score=74.47 gnl/MRDRNA2_/MRDRNA2_14645_c0_seq1:82-1248(-)
MARRPIKQDGRRVVLVHTHPERAQVVSALAKDAGFQTVLTSSTEEALGKLHSLGPDAFASIVCALGTCERDSCWPLLKQLKISNARQAFTIVLSDTATRSVKTRLNLFDAGAHMVTACHSSVSKAFDQVASILERLGTYACPICGLSGLTENALHLHVPFQHAAEPNFKGPCPICNKVTSNQALHLHNEHGPPEAREPPFAPFGAFSWIVCRSRLNGKFIMINEPAGIAGGKPGYWLPAGRVDIGETLVEAACRECLEEAGIAVRVTGVLKFMLDRRGTPRILFLAEPIDESGSVEPKSLPDWESVGALWSAVEDLALLNDEDYRAPDPATYFPKVASGELVPRSLDTDAFRALEKMVQQLTLGNKEARKDWNGVWEQIQVTYPGLMD